MSPSSVLRSLLWGGRSGGERAPRVEAATPGEAVGAATVDGEGADAGTVGEGADTGRTAACTIDVSHLPPPLPMVRILETLRDLGPGEILVVRHTRRPIHLYPRLDALGCAHRTVERGPTRFEISITTPTG